METNQHKLHRHPRYEHRLNLAADKCIVDAQFSSLFRGAIDRIECDGSHIIVSSKELEDVLFFLKFQHEMNGITQGRGVEANAEPQIQNLSYRTAADNSIFISGGRGRMESLFRFSNWRSFAAYVSCLTELRRLPAIDALVGIKDGESHAFVTKPLNEKEVEELRGMGCKIADGWERSMDYQDKRFFPYTNSQIITAIEGCEIKLKTKLPIPEHWEPCELGESDYFVTSLLMMDKLEDYRREFMGDFRSSCDEIVVDNERMKKRKENG